VAPHDETLTANFAANFANRRRLKIFQNITLTKSSGGSGSGGSGGKKKASSATNS
jgi:hypothetical protein